MNTILYTRKFNFNFFLIIISKQNKLSFQAELLLAAGAELNATNFAERTPLMIAAQSQNWDIAYYLIAKNARLNLQDHKGGFPGIRGFFMINITSYLFQATRPFTLQPSQTTSPWSLIWFSVEHVSL